MDPRNFFPPTDPQVESLEVVRGPCGAYSHCHATVLCTGDAGCSIPDCHIHNPHPHPHQPDQLLGTGPCPHQQLHGGSGSGSGGGAVCRVCVKARRVLLAVGSTNVPRLPAFATEWVEANTCTPDAPSVRFHGDQQQQQRQPASSPNTAPATQTTAQPCEEPRASSSSATPSSTSTTSSSSPAPKPWAGRMLHAWQVAAAFANRHNSQQQHQQRKSTSTSTKAASTTSSSRSRKLSGGAGAADGSAGGGNSCCNGLLAGQRVVVVGGGLTAAQLAALAARHGCRDVVMLARRELKVGCVWAGWCLWVCPCVGGWGSGGRDKARPQGRGNLARSDLKVWGCVGFRAGNDGGAGRVRVRLTPAWVVGEGAGGGS